MSLNPNPGCTKWLNHFKPLQTVFCGFSSFSILMPYSKFAIFDVFKCIGRSSMLVVEVQQNCRLPKYYWFLYLQFWFMVKPSKTLDKPLLVSRKFQIYKKYKKWHFSHFPDHSKTFGMYSINLSRFEIWKKRWLVFVFTKVLYVKTAINPP